MAYSIHRVEGRAERRDNGGPLVVWNAMHCPFAQRLLIALAFKEIPHERRDISVVDLYKNKPEGLLVANPLGQVPTIDDNGKHVRESLVCVEYVDDVWSNASTGNIMPTDPFEKALARLIVEDFSKDVIAHFYAMLSLAGEARIEKEQKCLESVRAFSRKLSSLSNGPFAFGDRFSFVEVALAPFAQRLSLLEVDGNFKVPSDDSFARFHQWWDAVKSHHAYASTAQTTEYLIEARATAAQARSKTH